MDYEYLQNVLGSPYVNEGAFNRLKAKGAQAMSSLGAAAGYQIQNPAETRLRSLWDGFMASLQKVMNDWKTQVSPMFGPDVKIPMGGKPIKNSLDRLAQTLTPYTPIKAGDSKLKTLTQEGLWDMAKRDMGLNKALTSNNPMVILNAYKNHILGLFQNFMRDAIKSTKLPAQQIYKTLAKMQPKESGWQAAGNMQRVVQQLQKLQTVSAQKSSVVPNSPVLSPSGTQPTPLPPSSTPSSVVPPSSTTTPSVASTQSLATNPPPQPVTPVTKVSPSSPSSAAASPKSDNPEIPPSDMPYVILKAFKIIVSAAKSDESHALGLFGTTNKDTKIKSGYPNLATSWGSGASVTSSLQEAHAQPHSGPESIGYVNPDVAAKSAEDDEWIHKEYPGEFLYNFHSRHNKFPSQPFSIRVTSPNETNEVKDASGNIIASVEVWWQSNGTFNKIFVVEVKDGKKSKPVLILRFSDHSVSAKSGAVTPGHSNFFDLESLMKKSNPDADLSIASPNIKSEIQNMKDDIFRALLATVHRKSMEFVSKGWAEKKAKEAEEKKAKVEMPTSTIENDGTLNYTDSTTGNAVMVTKDQLKTFLKGPLIPANAWRKRLESIGYFDTFTDMPVIASDTAIWKDANMALVALGYTKNAADKLLGNAWMHIKDNYPSASIWEGDANVTADQFIHAALKKKQSDIPKPPEPAPKPSTPASGGTSSPEPSKVSAPVSKSASVPPKENPVSSPVSGAVSAPVSGDVSKPVSNPKKKDKKTDGVTVTLKGDELVWTKADPNSKPDIVKVSDFMEKLKTNPQYLVALKSNPKLYAQFKGKLEGGEKPQTSEYINPFRKENFL